MISSAKEAEAQIKTLEIESRSVAYEITNLNAYDADIENAIEELQKNGTYEIRAKINLLFHEIINSIEINTEKRFFVVIFKNGIKRIINDNGFIINIDKEHNDLPVLPGLLQIPAEIVEDPERLLDYLYKLSAEE